VEGSKQPQKLVREMREKEGIANAGRLASAKAQNQKQREAATTKKSRDKAKKLKRTAEQHARSRPTKKYRVVDEGSSAVAVSAAPKAPSKVTTRDHRIKFFFNQKKKKGRKKLK
jgi:hypothetical protein